MSLARRQLGQAGEEAAARWYLAAGYAIVERNWRCREGEIDIIAERRDVLVFCEVKTRRSDAYGVPLEAVTARKQAKIRRLAAAFLATSCHRFAGDLRFDVASILGAEIEVIEGAF